EVPRSGLGPPQPFPKHQGVAGAVADGRDRDLGAVGEDARVRLIIRTAGRRGVGCSVIPAGTGDPRVIGFAHGRYPSEIIHDRTGSRIGWLDTGRGIAVHECRGTGSDRSGSLVRGALEHLDLAVGQGPVRVRPPPVAGVAGIVHRPQLLVDVVLLH